MARLGRLISVVTVAFCCVIFNPGQCAYQDRLTFETANSTKVAYEEWLKFENGFMSFAESTIKSFLPILVQIGSEAGVSPECTRAVFKMITGVNKGELWAMRSDCTNITNSFTRHISLVLDSIGKPSGGQLEGTTSSFGSYSQCVNTIAPDSWNKGKEAFRGQYCLLRLRWPLPPKPKVYWQWIKPESMKNYTLKTEVGNYLLNLSGTFYKTAFQMGLCVPSSCSKEDVEKVTGFLGKQMNVHNEVFSCETKEDVVTLDSDQIAVLITIAIFVLFAVTATLIQVFQNKEGPDKTNTVNSTSQQLIEAFSIKTNIIKTVDTSNGPKDETFSCLNGMKTISLIWVVVIHVYALMDPFLYRESVRSEKYAHTFSFQLITSGSLSVDTFFFITGILVAYQIVSLVDKKGIRTFNVPILIFRRVWRLIPSAMMTLGLVVILPLLNEGPVWKNETNALLIPTRKYWWTVLISISNFFKFYDMPMVSIWYIAADVQFFIMAIILLAIFFRNPKIAYIIMGVLSVLSMIISGALMCFENITPIFILGAPDRDLVFDVFYFGHTLPHNHVSVYILGMLIGIHFARNKDTKIPKWLVIASWPAFLLLLFAALFSADAFTHERLPNAVETFIFASFFRTVWGLGLSIMTILCATKNGRWVNDILSWKAFLALNRLTYLVYLLHVLFITYIFGSTLGVMDIADHLMVYISIGCLGLTFAGAFVMRIIFEAPVGELEKILLEKALGAGKSNENKNGKESKEMSKL